MTKAFIFLMLTGLSWVAVGAVVGGIGRRGFSLPLYQALSCIVCMAYGAINWIASPTAFFPSAGCPASTWAGVLAATLSCGIFEYLMIQAMGCAMRRGPNSIVWAIVQSGLIFPFLMGSFVFGVPIGANRAAGILLIVTSVFLYSSAREDGAEGSKTAGGKAPLRAWLVPAILGMLCCGTNQCGANLPSYLERGQDFSGAFRTFLIYAGILGASATHFAIRVLRGEKPRIPAAREVRTLAAIALCWGFTTFTISKYLRFPGLDILQRNNCGSMGYPTMVASCIAGFFVYGFAVLHERPRRLQWLGAAFALAGIALVAA